MSAPIKREDIRKGDRIRQITAIQYTATSDLGVEDFDDCTYELIERPVVLPTAPGWYVGRSGAENSAHLQLCDNDCAEETGQHWYRPDQSRVLSPQEVADFYLPLARLRPETEVAFEVLSGVRAAFIADARTFDKRIDILAKKWVTS